ncbi:dioxygenase [Neobacillus sp. NRS-1170]|uniref:dioxygenase family protein n=1 Tax=Neobacillus sp. NRS-1170 TaxID=3233898 RepID=UPI003D2E5158
MNTRLSDITAKITQHLHAVIQEFQVTEEELIQAIKFLTEVGKLNQYTLLSDVLGISVAVDEITHRSDYHGGGTENNVEGPLYRDEAPLLETPAKICSENTKGEMLILSGQVLSSDDQRPLPNALLDVWQANEHGNYENEDPEQPDYNLRGRIQCDKNGRFEIQTMVPAAYEIGKRGPVGQLLKNIGRHSWRPAHIHFKVTAAGFEPVTTQLFIPDDPWIESDSIGAVKDSLILKMDKCDDPREILNRGFNKPFNTSHYDFILRPKVLSPMETDMIFK